ncbi:MAG TPA: PDZ domain-containing protein, partial [Thermomonas sp.]|nr:PDZ domain-containing protein [Thermomonas sp.]
PAERAGILRQDVIRSINGQQVYESSDLPPIVGAMPPGTRVSIELVRDGKPRTVTATLNQLSEATAGPVVSDDGAPRPAAAAQANALGIVGEDLDPQQRSRLGLQAGEGVLVARVEGVAAREAGLRPGDVILAVGRNDVSSAARLNAQLRAAGAGKPVMLLVRRGGGTQYLTINPTGD